MDHFCACAVVRSCIYPPPEAHSPSVAARATLPAFLSRFFPFAGRIVANADTGVP